MLPVQSAKATVSHTDCAYSSHFASDTGVSWLADSNDDERRFPPNLAMGERNHLSHVAD